MPAFKLTPILLIMSYAQESRAVGKEKVNFAEREWTVLFPESLARVFGRLPFFVALCTSLWTMVLKTDGELDKKKKPSGRWLIPAESGLHSAVSPSSNCWWFVGKRWWKPLVVEEAVNWEMSNIQTKTRPIPVQLGQSHPCAPYLSRSDYWNLLITFKTRAVWVVWPHAVRAGLRSSDRLFQSRACTLNLAPVNRRPQLQSNLPKEIKSVHSADSFLMSLRNVISPKLKSQ